MKFKKLHNNNNEYWNRNFKYDVKLFFNEIPNIAFI